MVSDCNQADVVDNDVLNCCKASPDCFDTLRAVVVWLYLW